MGGKFREMSGLTGIFKYHEMGKKIIKNNKIT
jgi:hypothetical protein